MVVYTDGEFLKNGKDYSGESCDFCLLRFVYVKKKNISDKGEFVPDNFIFLGINLHVLIWHQIIG